MRASFPIAVHIFLIKNQMLLLLKRSNTGYEDGNYSVVAGHVEYGESARQAAVRETLEEIGVDIKSEELKCIGVMHRKSGDERVDFFFAVHNWIGNPQIIEPAKCSALYWCAMDVLPINTIPYIRQAIENLEFMGEQIWFQEFGWEGDNLPE